MGFVNKLRGEFVDIVEWIDDSRNSLVWRFPRYHNQIKDGAKLIVRPGQCAIFVDGGKIADVFEPGTYELSTRNLPILSTLKGWKHGLDSPFKAEVYFVVTRQITELKWGTPNPVLLRDPELGPLRVRAFGSFALRALKPKELLTELVGTDGTFTADEIDVLLRSIIATEFSQLIAKSEISIMDLAAHYGRLSEELRLAVLAKIDDEYGLDLPRLCIVNISVPEQVERAFDARSSMGVLEDLDRYQKFQLGESVPVAAANPAGGLAGAGVGMGMGLSYAGAAVPVAARQALPLIPPSPEASAAWYVALGGRTLGPFAAEQLGQAVGVGQFTGETLVWTAGMSGWTPMAQVARLVFLLSPPPAPPPVG